MIVQQTSAETGSFIHRSSEQRTVIHRRVNYDVPSSRSAAGHSPQPPCARPALIQRDQEGGLIQRQHIVCAIDKLHERPPGLGSTAMISVLERGGGQRLASSPRALSQDGDHEVPHRQYMP